MGFAELGLSEALLRAVSDSGYDIPTPIQKQAIPSVLMGRDIIGVAQTGTGKTASFVLPMIDILAEGRSRALMPRSLILEPTRELAQQVSENFDKYGKYHKLSMALLIGGVSMGDQLAALEKGVDVLIATPGRLMDLFGRGKIMLGQCGLLVIDEADRMLDMGFIPDIEEICTKLPASRQTLLFSATMPPPIKKLADKFMSDPKMVQVARPASTNTSITQWAVPVEPRGKRETLRKLLRDPELKNAIIFCNRKRDIKELVDSLRRSDFAVTQIHGDMEQADRIRELERFKSGTVNIIVASDVAARGLDIPGVSHVFNYDVPHHAEDYVHRIGRTGRAGRTGISYTLMTPDEAENLADVEKLIGQKVPRWGQDKGAAVPVPALPAEAEPLEPAPAVSPSRPDSRPEQALDDTGAPRKRRRGGRGRRKDGDPVRDASPPAAEPRAAREIPVAEAPRAPSPVQPPREPRRDDRPLDRPRQAPVAARSDNRYDRRDDRRGDNRRPRDDDDGERFVGFGPEGLPDFLTRKATLV
ncbi:DEAD/DEAH box helicase [Polymorphobacter sp.]|uniref:DEAD/DEAH box helicase n=1 Tax=Polymorphobacter sp. TaxID=1909290 RepID=UPI003F72CABE